MSAIILGMFLLILSCGESDTTKKKDPDATPTPNAPEIPFNPNPPPVPDPIPEPEFDEIEIMKNGICEDRDAFIAESIKQDYNIHKNLFQDRMNSLVTMEVPASKFKIGNGIEPGHFEPKENCVEFETEELFNQQGDPYELTKDSITHTYASGYDFDIYDDRLIGDYWGYRPYVDLFDFSNMNHFQYDINSEVFAYGSDIKTFGEYWHSTYGLAFTKNPKLKQSYKNLYDENPEDFYKKCGRRFISGFSAGHTLSYIVFAPQKSIFSSIPQSLKEELKTISDDEYFVNKVAYMFEKSYPMYIKLFIHGASDKYAAENGKVYTLDTVESIRSAGKLIESIKEDFNPLDSEFVDTMETPYELISELPFNDSENQSADRKAYLTSQLYERYTKNSQQIYRAEQELKHIQEFDKSWEDLCLFGDELIDSCQSFLEQSEAYIANLKKENTLILKKANACKIETNSEECKETIISQILDQPWANKFKDTLRLKMLDYCKKRESETM